MTLEGRIALVAGASSGIGAAIARALAGRGARVICASRDLARLEPLVGELGPGAHALALDVADAGSAAGVLERLPEALRAVEVLVNCAGHDPGGRRRLDEGEVADWASTIETNVTGTIRMCHAIIPGMLARGRGHLVNIGSIAGIRTYPKGSIYSASKFAVHALTDILRQDYAGTDLRVTEILPGLVRTGFAAARHHGDQDKAQAFYDSFPAALAPEDVARCVVFALELPAEVSVTQLVVEPTRS